MTVIIKNESITGYPFQQGTYPCHLLIFDTFTLFGGHLKLAFETANSTLGQKLSNPRST